MKVQYTKIRETKHKHKIGEVRKWQATLGLWYKVGYCQVCDKQVIFEKINNNK